jgi:hypothetical protein
MGAAAAVAAVAMAACASGLNSHARSLLGQLILGKKKRRLAVQHLSSVQCGKQCTAGNRWLQKPAARPAAGGRTPKVSVAAVASWHACRLTSKILSADCSSGLATAAERSSRSLSEMRVLASSFLAAVRRSSAGSLAEDNNSGSTCDCLTMQSSCRSQHARQGH